MIWLILAFLGIPLWLCAAALVVLLRGRSRITHLPEGCSCKSRAVSGELPGLKPDFARITGVGQWIHTVLVLHGGPFAQQRLPTDTSTNHLSPPSGTTPP